MLQDLKELRLVNCLQRSKNRKEIGLETLINSIPNLRVLDISYNEMKGCLYESLEPVLDLLRSRGKGTFELNLAGNAVNDNEFS